ncbi:putative DNA modification/repair radical SAM protein [Persicimonas caeni]|uniref:Putative DNA modification/repair radical SAM protein n=1 Tax=Persicimonas caeni TaxID=2292766 RepID=A0A4Y6PYY1_PERCE|nr:putative DNA modification/repair radical SAM protein [Persicimonas caeni]QDG53440.1 putative DNA modification/repair radical SAM protein [Persicimonas caeni]QED34661.1 putative DNA modification/repair radical SAM protein [Persicimonas caeni]
MARPQVNRNQVNRNKTIKDKLAILADAAKYDASCASSGVKRKNKSGGLGNSTGVGICHSYTPDGRCISLLKILLTNFCIYDCKYCINRASSNVPRARFTPDEVVRLTVEFYKRNYIEGLFLSSGIIRDVDYTMDQLAEVARKLRQEHDFNGYIHLKAVPGASDEAVQKAGRWADRLSANIELPTQDDLDELAPAKTVDDVEKTMGEIRQRRDEAKAAKKSKAKDAPRFMPAGQSTQMIVGATPSTDRTILQTADRLYTNHKLKRVYYSAYSPIPDVDPMLPAQTPPLIREHRLYQADWLMRFYGFQAAEIVEEEDNLPLDIDPKLAWAIRHRDLFPVDLNRASFEEIVRVPGIGVRNAKRIVAMRRKRRVRLEDLRKMRSNVRKAAPFVITADKNPHLRRLDDLDLRYQLADRSEQLSLFDAGQSSRLGA